MRLVLGRPSPKALDAVAHQASALLPDYAPVGGTLAPSLPDAPFAAHDEAVLGRGRAAWDAACDALDDRAMFALPWLALPTRIPGELHTTMAYASRLGPVWSLNACRVVDAGSSDEELERRRFFVHGTIPPHGLRGEERFQVTWSRTDDQVRFSITQFSWPSHWLVALGSPVVRLVQRRFVQDATAAMARAVAERTGRDTG